MAFHEREGWRYSFLRGCLRRPLPFSASFVPLGPTVSGPWQQSNDSFMKPSLRHAAAREVRRSALGTCAPPLCAWALSSAHPRRAAAPSRPSS
mmetsp:Transcript_15508/g.30038  ORF Transcript_15508/g.30038 Transcript_15508/m.30038 type:complete len:93 (-) Transcript_15508:24-302(-)